MATDFSCRPAPGRSWQSPSLFLAPGLEADAYHSALAKVNAATFVGLALGLLLTFPPVMDFIQGK